MNELEDYDLNAFTEIDGHQNLCQSVLDRYEGCCKVESGHLEHLRD